MRILHITDGIPPQSFGGTGQIVSETARAQAQSGHDVCVLSAMDSTVTPPVIQGVRLLRIAMKSAKWAHYRSVFSGGRGSEVFREIDAVKPELIHAHTISRQCGYRWIDSTKRRGIPIVVTCHDVSHIAHGKVSLLEKHLWLSELRRWKWYWNPFRRAMIQRALAQVDRMLTVSDALKAYMEQWGYRGLTTVHNGIDLTFWHSPVAQADARRQLHLPVDAPLFLIAGRLGHDKGVTLVSEVLPKNCHLLVAGDKPGELLSPVLDRSHFFPAQKPDGMRMLYCACDAVLVPSRCIDCFPTVCLEAMALGRPVLATTWGGAKESVEDGRTGWIMDPYDTGAWRRRIEWCAAHREELNVIGADGRLRMEKHFSLEKNTENLLSVYRDVLR